LEQAGIYQINCKNCNFIYIGKTIRNFIIRFKEHFRSYRLNKPNNSNVAKHMLSHNHTFDLTNLKVLHIAKRGFKLDLLESLEIQKAVKNKKKINK